MVSSLYYTYLLREANIVLLRINHFLAEQTIGCVFFYAFLKQPSIARSQHLSRIIRILLGETIGTKNLPFAQNLIGLLLINLFSVSFSFVSDRGSTEVPRIGQGVPGTFGLEKHWPFDAQNPLLLRKFPPDRALFLLIYEVDQSICFFLKKCK